MLRRSEVGKCSSTLIKFMGGAYETVSFVAGCSCNSRLNRRLGDSSPIYGVKIPAGYRDWKMIATAQLLVPGKVDQLRAQLGNDIAIKAYKEGTLPFPDGAIIAAIHWTRVASEDNNKVLAGPFPGAQSFVVGSHVNIQLMVKDSKKYASTGGWGFADFKDGKPGDKALHETCFTCHIPAKDRDYVFTRYAP
jgi:hypothetical protein